MEAYIGEYASGKSETAVNRALDLARLGRKVTLVDLDTVEPFYTLRPIKKELMAKGINVIAWETKETTGLGEAGSVLLPEMRWALRKPGDIILDVGYGVHGARTLNLVEGAYDSPELKVYCVVNISRPMTATVEEIVEYVRSLGRVDGLINNSHLGDATDLEIIQQGARIVSAAAQILNIPVIATVVDEKFSSCIGPFDEEGNPVRIIHRFMPCTYW
ncbi:MAG: hypothetical protein HPY81_10615 [Firmicutes bacterium]|nr:hypothetical protein [Bacillota bacterium]